MKKITILLLLFTAVTFGQVTYDFENPAQVPQFAFDGVGFANVVNPDAVNNPSARALEVNKPDAAQWFSGFGFETPSLALVDLSLGTEFTFKVWAPIAGQTVRFRLQNSINGAPAFNVDTVIPVAGVWTDVTIDFDSQTNGTEQYAVFVIQPNYDINCEGATPACTTVGAGNGGIWYIDDIFQSFDPSIDASLSDLTLDGTTIAGFSPSNTTYDVELPNGTTVPPTVAGVATQAGNGASNVDVTQAIGVPGTATLDVTAPDGTTTRLYTVNFTEAAALPPAAPVPTETNVVPILTNNPAYSDRGVPFFEPFGSTTAFYDLDSSGADDALSFQGGNGGQVNYFGNEPFVDIASAGIFHIDFYCENLDAGDNFRVVLLPQNTAFNMEFRITVDETQPGTWQSFDIGLAGAGSGLPDEFTGADISNFGDLALIQIFPAEAGSTLGSELVYVSNIYFSGGTLSRTDVNLSADFNVYPNPTQNVWNVKTNNQDINSIQIIDIQGRQVMNLIPNTTEAIIDASSLPAGLYFARINTVAGSKSIKLIKQ